MEHPRKEMSQELDLSRECNVSKWGLAMYQDQTASSISLLDL